MASAASRATHYGKRSVIDELARRLSVSESCQNTAPLEIRGGRRLPPVCGDIWQDFGLLFNRLLIFSLAFLCVNARQKLAENITKKMHTGDGSRTILN